MVARLEIERGALADLAQDLGVLLRVAFGRRGVREVGKGRQELVDLGVDGGQLLLESLDLVPQGARLGRVTPAPLSLPAQFLDPGQQGTATLVKLEQLVDPSGRPAAGERGLDALRIASDQLEVERGPAPRCRT